MVENIKNVVLFNGDDDDAFETLAEALEDVR